VRFRSYLCKADPAGSQPFLRAEFHRFSDAAASILVNKIRYPSFEKAIGRVHILENEVYATYADLLERFGTVESDAPSVTFSTPGAQDVFLSEVRSKKITTLTGVPSADGWFGISYPATTEIESILKRNIPNNINYYIEKIEDGPAQIIFWRSVKRDDIRRYSANLNAYNRLIMSTPRSDEEGSEVPKDLPPVLKLIDYIVGENWPEDFVIMLARVDLKNFNLKTEGCGGPNIDFKVDLPRIILDTILLENISKQPITVDWLYGYKQRSEKLRSTWPVSESEDFKFKMSRVLEPGEKVLFPTKITFAPQSDDDTSARSKKNEASVNLQQQGELRGFSGNLSANKVPSRRAYFFGPQLTVQGVIIQGNRIAFNQQSSNYSDVVVSREGLSCPFLMAWDEKLGRWIDHGKILDKAPSAEREYSEVKSFPGFQSKFRIEEREPEIAFVRSPELLVVLKDNRTIRLQRKGDHVMLYWGDKAEISFQLPDDIPETSVIETRLILRGYYQRYSALVARVAQPLPAP
jgi:hypothetical protein